MSPAGRKTALVLSGGGAYGAFEVGVLKALLTGQSPTTGFEPLVPDIVSGTSVGAYNSTFLVSRLAAGGAKTAYDLEQTWLERIAGGPGACGNGVFRVRLDPAEYAQPSCYVPDPLQPLFNTAQDALYFSAQFMARTAAALRSQGPLAIRALREIDISALLDMQPFHELIQETIDFEAVYRSRIKLRITATVWETGLPREFDNVSRTVTPLSVRASASIPVVFPPTLIGGEPFVDGGLSLNTPLTPAIAAGAEVLHVIFLDPWLRDIPMRLPISTVAELYRIMAILFANETRAQIVQLDQINRALRLLENAPRKARDEDLAAFLYVLDQLRDHVARTRIHRPIEVYVYRPSPEVLEDLAGFINFERSYVQRLIDAGCQEAVDRSPEPVTSAAVPLNPSFLQGY